MISGHSCFSVRQGRKHSSCNPLRAGTRVFYWFDPHAHLPHRLVAHTLFLVEEKYECTAVSDHLRDPSAQSSSSLEPLGNMTSATTSGSPDEHTAANGDFRLQAHVWEFETDVGVSFNSGENIKLQWRVRNINNVLKPRRGHVLKSDGLVVKKCGRWIY